MDRQDFFFEQLVTEGDLDGQFDSVEQAINRLQTDNGYIGIVAGLDVVENTPTPNLNVTVSNGVAYDQLGQRIGVVAPQTVDASIDSNALSTAVANPGNEKFVSIFAEFERVLSDPRVDGNGLPLFYQRNESFTLRVVQGAESAAGTPATLTSANVETYALSNGQTLDLQVDGGAVQTVTFNSGSFVNIAAATAAEVALVITAQASGVTAADVGGFVVLTTTSNGLGSSVAVTGGSSAAAFAFPVAAGLGAGGPARPALLPDAILLADIKLRFGTTQIFDAPDPGGSAGVIDTIRRELVFSFTGGAFSLSAGTVTGFANELAALLNSHIANTGNAHPASAITYSPTGNLIALDVQAALDELEAEKSGLAYPNTFTDTNTFNSTAAFNSLFQVNTQISQRDPDHTLQILGGTPNLQYRASSSGPLITVGLPLDFDLDDLLVRPAGDTIAFGEVYVMAWIDGLPDTYNATSIRFVADHNDGLPGNWANIVFQRHEGTPAPNSSDMLGATPALTTVTVVGVDDALVLRAAQNINQSVNYAWFWRIIEFDRTQ